MTDQQFSELMLALKRMQDSLDQLVQLSVDEEGSASKNTFQIQASATMKIGKKHIVKMLIN